LCVAALTLFVFFWSATVIGFALRPVVNSARSFLRRAAYCPDLQLACQTAFSVKQSTIPLK
jgi:hypothetical protein